MAKNFFLIGGCTGTKSPNTGQRATIGPNGLPRPIPLHRGDFGTQTSSFAMVVDGTGLFFDNGTGIGNVQAAFAAVGINEAYGFNSHLHLDHTEAFQHNILLYNFDKKNLIKKFYLPILGQGKPTDVIGQSLSGGKWPISPKDVPLGFFTPGENIECGKLTVKTHLQNHPDGGSAAFRIRVGNKRVVIATDNEVVGEDLARAYAGFVNGADILYADIQYTQDEYDGKVGIMGGRPGSKATWGHSTPEMILSALEYCTHKPKLVLAGHHDATRDEADLLAFEKKLAAVFATKGIEARSAREFECIEV
jgi:hypothetical protein